MKKILCTKIDLATTFKEWRSIFTQSFQLLKKYWQIYAIILLFSSYQILRSIIKLHPLINLVINLLNLGWLGARFELISSGVKKNSIDWKILFPSILKNTRKLLPAAVLFITVFGFFLLLFLVAYSEWFFTGTPAPSNDHARIEQFAEMFRKMPQEMQTPEFKQTFGLAFEIFEIITIAFSLLAIVTLTFEANTPQGIWKSAKNATHFMKENPLFFSGVFLLKYLLAFLNSQLNSFLYQQPMVLNLRLQSFPSLIFFSFFNLLIEVACVVYFYKNQPPLNEVI